MNRENYSFQRTDSCLMVYDGALEMLPELTQGRRTVTVVDALVEELYERRMPEGPLFRMPAGDANKTLHAAGGLYLFLKKAEVDRRCMLVAIGGGVVCDVAGFVASTYMRGIDFGLVPTTLLAQVDAAIGGKNGVNFQEHKNLIGAFEQPCFILEDHRFLETLPTWELRNGLAEMVKTALVTDAALFDELERLPGDDDAALLATLPPLIEKTARAKWQVVLDDEREAGPRRVLNFGHTLGHAIEKSRSIPHGEAVAMGMVFALEQSVADRLLDENTHKRVLDLFRKLHLPTSARYRKDDVTEALRMDKKREADGVNFVMIEGIGRPVIRPLSFSQLRSRLS